MKAKRISIFSVLLISVLVLSLMSTAALAAQKVKIGFMFPLTGSLASTGQDLKSAAQVALAIINQEHPELKGIPLAAGKGLPNLGNAQLVPVFVDTQGSPSVGQTQAIRLITQNSVAAVVGSYQSSVTKTTSRVAERYGIPFMNATSTSATLNKRGFKWFFRTTPNFSQFASQYMDFFDYLNKHGHGVKTLAIVYENTDYGTSGNKYITKAAKDAGYKVILDIAYSHNTTNVVPQVTKLESAKPDAVIFISYTSDAILYMQTLKDLRYKPKVLIGDDSGFSDPSFIPTVGPDAQGALNRSSWVVPAKGSPGYLVNQMFKKKTGHVLDGSSAREVQGVLALAEAINRAGSTDPAAIRKALTETNLSAKQIIMPWKGIKFNGNGQNVLGGIVLVQLFDNGYEPVWPTKYATHKLALPYKGWQ